MQSTAPKNVRLDTINNIFRWSHQEIRASSPCRIPNSPKKQTRKLLSLFGSECLLIGRFRHGCGHGPYQCLPHETLLQDVSSISGVVNGTVPRAASQPCHFFASQKFYIFNTRGYPDPQGHCAVLRCLRDFFDLRLRAVLELKGGDGYEAWFDRSFYNRSDLIRNSLRAWGWPNPNPFDDYAIIAELPTGGACELIYLDNTAKGGSDE
jgi:hypothetical protein